VKPLLPVLLFAVCSPTAALERLELQAASVEMPAGVTAANLQATLQLLPGGRSSLQASASTLRTGHRDWVLQELRLQCAELLVQEPHFECRRGNLAAQQTPLGAMRASTSIAIHSGRGAVAVRLGQLPLAGGQLNAYGTLQQSHWELEADSTALALQPLLKLLRPWWQPPPGMAIDGTAQAKLRAAGRSRQVESLQASLSLAQLALQNESGNVVSENLRAEITGTASGSPDDLAFQVRIGGLGGQALAGPVLLDLTSQALRLETTGHFTSDRIALTSISIEQPGLVQADGTATLKREADWLIDTAQFRIQSLQFPAAYTSLLQLTLAATEFGALETRGRATGSVTLQRNRLSALDLTLEEISLADPTRNLGMRGIAGDIHWRAAAMEPPAVSTLSWDTLQAYGLDVGAATLQFHARGSALQLEAPARLPLFDGAMVVQRFSAGNLGSSNVDLGFDAVLEPISMQQLSRAFGWPELSGSISGRIPGLEFRSGTLRFAGDMTAEIFDGRVVASNLQLRDAFGNFPRLSGNFIARGLDLELITRTFPIGSITGRLDADITGLELFGWSPVAFDANLYTTPGDRSRHRISQKAVGNLAKLGGGGGGVVAALQGGFLRFFDDFGYDRLGLHCKLQDDVCQMAGISRAGSGYYIVKGGGLPRIDVIGNSTRVAWAQLLGQITSALESENVVVK